MCCRSIRSRSIAAALCGALATATVTFAQEPMSAGSPGQSLATVQEDYVIGPQDVLAITSYDQPELSGRFAVETDGTFTYPLIGRIHVGALTLRAVEALLKARLMEEGFFTSPQITVSIVAYKSQRVFVVGEVRQPGAYPLSGDMRLIEALALAGSMLPTASGAVVIARGGTDGQPQEGVRLQLRDLENGLSGPNVMLGDGDTIFVLRAENVFVFGHVKSPGAYPLPDSTMVLQALSLAGGLTDRGSTSRIEVVRNVNGKRQTLKVSLTDFVQPGDTIVVPQRFF